MKLDLKYQKLNGIIDKKIRNWYTYLLKKNTYSEKWDSSLDIHINEIYYKFNKRFLWKKASIYILDYLKYSKIIDIDKYDISLTVHFRTINYTIALNEVQTLNKIFKLADKLTPPSFYLTKKSDNFKEKLLDSGKIISSIKNYCAFLCYEKYESETLNFNYQNVVIM